MRDVVARFGFAGAIFAVPVAALAAAWCFPGAAGPLLVAAGLACVLAALATIHAARARERARNALRGVRIPPERAGDEWRRGGSALALVVPAFVVVLALLPVALWRPRLDFTIGSPPRQEPLQTPPGADELDTNGTPPQPAGGSSDPAPGDTPQPNALDDVGRGPGVSPSATSFSDPWLLRRTLILVEPSRGGVASGSVGALYLRGLVFPAMDDAGRFHDEDERFEIRRDANDGDLDGWTHVGPGVPEDRALDLDVHQFAISHPRLEWTLAHAPSSASALARRKILAARDGGVLLPPEGREWIDYRVRCRLPWEMPYPTDRTMATVSDARTLALPPGLPVTATLGAMAREATRDAASDLARVRAVVRTLRDGWQYEPIDESLTGMAALDVFVTDRKGTCVQFAEASAVMLRSIGIPARVVHGFLLRNWDEQAARYYARGRDYHAWIEVEFEGCGWVTFDATPIAPDDVDVADARRPAPATDAAREDEGGGFEGLAESLQAVNGGIRESVAEHPWLWAIAATVSVLTLARILRSRHERLSGHGTSDATDRTPWGRLLAALARHGHRRRPSETALEFAFLVAASDTALAPFVELSRRQQAARFGGVAMGPDDLRRVDELRSML